MAGMRGISETTSGRNDDVHCSLPSLWLGLQGDDLLPCFFVISFTWHFTPTRYAAKNLKFKMGVSQIQTALSIFPFLSWPFSTECESLGTSWWRRLAVSLPLAQCNSVWHFDLHFREVLTRQIITELSFLELLLKLVLHPVALSNIWLEGLSREGKGREEISSRLVWNIYSW